MTAPTTTTTGVDVNFKDPTIIAESGASGVNGPGVPTVGTNQVARWELWDPNRWWTDWRIPPKPQATWERWFDWIGQLRAQVPAIRAAADDWRTLTGQLDSGLQAVQRQRPDLATWTGPSGQTMSQALDNLETAVRSRADAVRGNPAVLEDLATSIEDAVAPMTALDAEYQQVLTNDAQCRAVALRGAPIMLAVADKLLTAGNTLQNSARDEKRAPMPAPVQPLVLQSGAQGPTDQLDQVAGSAGNVDPGAVAPGTVVQPPAQPAVAPPGTTVDSGAVTTAAATARAGLPGVAPAAGGVDPGAVAPGTVLQPPGQPDVTAAGTGAAGGGVTAAGATGRADLPDVMLAGGSAGTVAPIAPTGATAAAPVPGVLSTGAAMPVGGAGMLAGGAMPAGAGMLTGGGTSTGGAMPTGAVPTGGAPAVGAVGPAGAPLPGTAPVAVGAAAPAGRPAEGSKRERERAADPMVAFLVPPAAFGGAGAAGSMVRPGAATGASGRVAVPGGLLGRTAADPDAPRTVVTGLSRRRPDGSQPEPEDADVLDSEAWHREPGGPGLVDAPQDR